MTLSHSILVLLISIAKSARDLDPSVAAYPGNLSAALAENGIYLEASDAIRQAEEIIRQQPSNDGSLLGRLSNRLAKCLYYQATEKYFLDAKFVSDNEPHLLSGFRGEAVGPKASRGGIDTTAYTSTLFPFGKVPCKNTGLEFFTIGHDPFHSLLQGFLDGWGLSPERTCPGDSDIVLHRISSERRLALSFLFGGVGDARHVFSTFIDICAQGSTADAAMHFTLLDIQPAALARDLIILFLLLSTPMSFGDEYILSAKTVFYVFSGVAMPPDSHALVLKTCRDLAKALDGSGPSLPAYISIDPELVRAILACMEFWIDLPPSISTPKVLRHVAFDSQNLLASITNPQIRRECEVYSTLKVLLPPYTTQVDALEAAHDQVEYGTPKALAGVRKYIENNWKPNSHVFVVRYSPTLTSFAGQTKLRFILARASP
ncbi:hypothetical protein C8R44DRAFT_868456 [Mycena epipterygia]|nr:hypothetical protein C8R44DRAFT_868456 [Mycena epipterygia]